MKKVTRKDAAIITGFVSVFCLGNASAFWILEEFNIALFALSLSLIGLGILYSPLFSKRKLSRDTAAVSPVIAVILMVAITVVLAATVFVLVSDIGGQTGTTAPQIAWAPDETQDRLAVNTATQNADWARLSLSSSTSGAKFALNGPATGTSPVLGRVSTTADKIAAGDYLEFCVGTLTLNVEIVVTDTTANAIVLRHTFTELAAC